ncbi:MAG: alpha-galactosidase [bacterium]|nr:alpha-galactosidase [bacterium]
MNNTFKWSASVVVTLAIVVATMLVWWRYVPLHDGVYVVGNSTLAWHLQISNRLLQTTCIVNRRTGARLPVAGDDFAIRIGHARTIGRAPEFQKPNEQWPPYMVRDGVTITPSVCQPVRLMRGWRSWKFMLHCPAVNANIYLVFRATPGQPWLQRQILLQSCDGTELATDQAAYHLRWRIDQPATLGGQGQPLLFDNTWFIGLEHPAGENLVEDGLTAPRQYPGDRFSTQPFALQSLVLGGGITGQVRRVLQDYVSTLRRPPRSLTLFNTWSHLRGDNLNEDNMVETATALQRNLQPFGTTLDVFAIDDGWFTPQSIWEPDYRKLPTGMAGLRARIEACNMRLGLWLPLCGHSLDMAWAKSNGYEALQKYLCLSGTKYNTALRTQLQTLISDAGLRYFKHDFNYFWCGQSDHGHFPSIPQGVEANVNAELALLRMESRQQPGLFLAITSGIWPSPWWLPYIDTIWMGGGDHDYNRNLPASQGSSFEMNYRDGALYDMLVTRALVFPLSALMTHGIVDGRHTPYDVRQEPDETWATYVMNYLGRGTLMRELYLTPENLTVRRWELLARGLNWARTLDACMTDARIAGGDARRGELVVYSGAHGPRCYLSARNPLLESQAVPLHTLGITSGFWQIVYPYQQVVDAAAVTDLRVAGEGMLQLQTAATTLPLIHGARAALLAATSTTTTFLVAYHPGSATTVRVTAPMRITALAAPDGIVAKDGAGWRCTLPAAPDAETQPPQFHAQTTNGGPWHAVIILPRATTARCKIVLRDAGATAQIQLNGAPQLPTINRGNGWQLLTVPLRAPTNQLEVAVNGPGVAAQLYLDYDRTLRTVPLTITHAASAPANPLALPLPLLHNLERVSFCCASNLILRAN